MRQFLILAAGLVLLAIGLMANSCDNSQPTTNPPAQSDEQKTQ